MKTATPSKPQPAKRSIGRDMPPVALPEIVSRRLHALSGRVLQIAWLEGILLVIGGLCGVVLIQTTLDWLFDLPWRTRLLFALADLGMFGWLVYRYGIRPWLRRMTPEQAALHAEKFWPALKCSLISAVQLARKPEGSRRMVENLVVQVARRLEQLDLREAVATRHLRRLVFAALALVILTAVAGWGTAPKSFILLRRLLLSNISLPTQTLIIPVSENFAIQPGQTIELSAKAEGVIPRSGRVEVAYEGKSSQTIVVQGQRANPKLFSLTLPNVQQPLTYRFFLNDGHGLEYHVSLLHGPVLENVTFDQIYPAYTGLAQTHHSAGNLTLLAGSKLRMAGRSDQPLRSVHALIQKGDRKVELAIAADKKSFAGEVDIPAQGMEGFSIILENSDGVASQDNALYRVEVTPDKPPEITVAPGQPDQATMVATAHPRLRFEVRDDFKTKQVFLCYQANADAAETGAPEIKKIPLTVSAPAGALAFNYEWTNPAESGIWKEGATINYWIEAVDNNDVTGPGVGRTPNRQWQIISIDAKRQELTERLRQHAESMEDLSRTQEELRSNVGDLLKQDDKK